MDFILSNEITIGSLTCYEFFSQLAYFVWAWAIIKLFFKSAWFCFDKLIDFFLNKYRKSKLRG